MNQKSEGRAALISTNRPPHITALNLPVETPLGLAIVKTCGEACKGTVTALQNTPTDLKVQLHFPQ